MWILNIYTRSNTMSYINLHTMGGGFYVFDSNKFYNTRYCMSDIAQQQQKEDWKVLAFIDSCKFYYT